MYADFGDFSLWRIRPLGGLYVGGFGRAARLRAAELAPDPAAVAADRGGRAGIIAHCNADHPGCVGCHRRIARRHGGWLPSTWTAAIWRRASG